MRHDDTICAISSATGPADRMIVRLSGPATRQIVGKIANGAFIPSAATACDLSFSELVVPAIVYTFAAPKSVTGEDVAELHIPGNPLLARLMLAELIALGARSAEPGEFTARGFFNGKLDLPQAEAVATLVSAENAGELSAARKSLSGELARRLTPIMQRLVESLALIEAAIDFSEEEIEFASHETLRQQIDSIELDLTNLLEQSARFERLSHEPSIVLVGRPNAGKSSLLNALIGHERAVVSDVAGTTRDALSVRLPLLHGPVRLIDVAGLEKADRTIDVLMQARASEAIESADVIVAVRDCTDTLPSQTLPREPHLKLASKNDLGGETSSDELPVSIHDPSSLATFRQRLDAIAFGESFASDSLALNTRHVLWIKSALTTLAETKSNLKTAALELTAADLRHALNGLGEVLGQMTPDDVLGRVFANFCIGK